MKCFKSLLLLLLPAAAALAATPVAPVLQIVGFGAMDDITGAATEIRTPGGVFPLPLASSWATGLYAGGFDPAYQVDQIKKGHRLLPWFQLPADGRTMPASYYESATQDIARNHLPLTLVSTQWEVAVAAALTPVGGAMQPLSPFSPLPAWYEAGLRWGRHPMLARMQELYPDPPRIIFLSNNEQPKLWWHEVRDQGLLPAALGDEEIRRRVGDAWVLRYRELIRGFRDGLVSPAWRRNSRFVGYDAFGFVDYFRWDGWLDYSLNIPGRFEPWPLAWDGASVTYYTSDWSKTTDFNVFSPQVGASNLVPMRESAERMHVDDYWFELSIWDGQTGDSKGKDASYRSLGQTYDPARYQGFVQFGLWTIRPRVAREFRNPDQSRAIVGAYFDVIVAAVDRVHDDPVLRKFWRAGKLLQNETSPSPYQSSVPADWQRTPRWFLLDSSGNPPRPWDIYSSQLQVFSLALQLGNSTEREWLVYAFSPLASVARDVDVRIPGGPTVTVRSSRSGCFTQVRESDRRQTTIGC